MEISGRSVDRSREISIKKPRLASLALADNVDIDVDVDVDMDKDKERGSPMLERMRAIEREKERERRSMSLLENEDQKQKQKPPQPQPQPQQELVNQYKTALGELVFNSKPIITNLTIIAGENKRFAKDIAATVCSHILEVPNDQKLPSLYLLDSIVKNIGVDYVKYFAARLPEVFCKAYRRVDPAIHPGMQHLFRTWRGVFPSMPLRVIEEELQFLPSMNGSSPAVTTPRTSDTQSQRPGHSIHVNPKYLEARQQLQQSNRAEKVCSENNGEEPGHESDRPETSMNASLKGWSESPLKIPSIQHQPRSDSNETVYGQKKSAGFSDYNYGMDPIRSLDMGIERPDEQLAERDTGMERSWYGERESSNTSVTYNQRNFSDWQKLPTRGPLIDAYGNYRGPKSARVPLLHVHSAPDITNRSSMVSRNWQNSEEEEYMWEDMSARSGDHGSLSDKPRKFPGDMEKPLRLGIGKRMRPEPDLPDGHWRTVGPLVQMDPPRANEDRIPRRGLDDTLASPLLHHDIGAQSSIEASMESSNIFRTSQNTMVEQSLPNWPQKHLSLISHARSRMLPVDFPNQSSLSSINAGQSEALAISSSNGCLSTSIGPSLVPRPSFWTNNGTGTQPPSFGALPHVMPIPSGLPSGQRQPSKPPSPSKIPSIKQLPGSPTSAFPRKQSVQPVQSLQQNNLIRADDLEVHNQTTHPSQLLQSHHPLSHGQKTQKPQTNSDSSSQLLHSHVQSGNSTPLQMSHIIQPLLHFQNQSAAIPPQQGHPVQFLHQAPTETLVQQIQPVSLSQPSIPTHALQQPDLRTKVQPSPPRFGPSQTLGYSASGISTNSSSLQGQTNTQNLIDAILKSGILPANTIQAGSNPQPIPSSGFGGFSDIGAPQSPLHLQPPLPSGPPPVQFSAATMVSLQLPPAGPLPISTPLSSHSGPMYKPAVVPSISSTPMLSLQPLKVIQPPLPPGPPPASSLVAPTLQATSSVTTSLPSINPVSNLLNSLVAQGLISAPTESTLSSHMLTATSLIPNQLHNYSMAVVTTSISQASVCVSYAAENPVHSKISVHTSASAVPSLKTFREAELGKNLIGHEFKRERILEHHPFVISALYDGFLWQCKTCGLRSMSQDEHDKHMDWHVSRVHVQKSQSKLSRRWYPCHKDWLSGGTSTTAFSFFSQEANQNDQESNEPAVPSNENQAVCALCGEVFEEIYNDETEEWMFKGTVYLNASSGGVIESKDRSLLGPIVHAKCRSDSAALKLGDSNKNVVDDDYLECRRKTMQK